MHQQILSIMRKNTEGLMLISMYIRGTLASLLMKPNKLESKEMLIYTERIVKRIIARRLGLSKNVDDGRVLEIRTLAKKKSRDKRIYHSAITQKNQG